MDRDTIKHIAKLSRLYLSDAETRRFTQELGSILSHVSDLARVDTQGVRATGCEGAVRNVFRADETARAADAALSVELVRAAPDAEDGYVKVKAIL